jgi:DNA-binding transcriptional LysR family regulator
MDLRQLAALTAVADHHSFSAAARALHTVQSNISTHVARLERELGTALVERSTGELTEAGEVVVARARRVQAELAALTADVASSLGEISGHVRLGVIGTTGRWLVPALLTALAEALPRGPAGHHRRHHHLAAAPAGQRPARPGRRQPAGIGPRRRHRSPCSRRSTWSSPPTATRSPPTIGWV